MNLDDLDRFKQLDTLNMIGEIDNLPDQLDFAYQLGLKQGLPEWKDFRQVVIAGMGGSAIGADLLASYCGPLALLPVSVHRDYGLPMYALGKETLVICSSHSGNTEETLDAFEVGAQSRVPDHCRMHRRRTCKARQGTQRPRMDVRTLGTAACRGRIFLWFAACHVPAIGIHTQSKGSNRRRTRFDEEITGTT